MNEVYKIGDRVLHPFYGVCVVKKIEKLTANKQIKEYYQLICVTDEKRKIYLPVGTHEIKLKRVE